MRDHKPFNKREKKLKTSTTMFFKSFKKEAEPFLSGGNPLFKFLLVGLILRLTLAPFLGHPYDLRVFMAVGSAVAHGATPYGRYVLEKIFEGMPHPHLFGSFYGIGYPPPWGLILGLMYELSSIISPNNIYFYVFTLKIPIILGDLVTSFVLYKILKTKINVDVASRVFRFYLLCPFIIVISAVWGMFDILVFLFSILSACFLLDKPSWSAISLAFASSLKPYAIILAPIYSILVYKKSRSFKRAAYYLLGFLGLLALITVIPMLVFKWPLSNLYHALYAQMTPRDFYSAESNNGTFGAASPFNILNVLRLFDTEVEAPWFLNYTWIGACLVWYFYSMFRTTETDLKSIFNLSFVTSLIFFTTRFWVSEQNLIFLLSFFILSVVFNRKREVWKFIHILWIILLAFVLIHVPATAFLWIVYPWTLDAATAFCNGPLGYIRWVMMSLLTFSWLAVLWFYTFRRVSAQ